VYRNDNRPAEDSGTHPIDLLEEYIPWPGKGIPSPLHHCTFAPARQACYNERRRSVCFNEDHSVLTVDGQPVELKQAYSSVYRSNEKNTFLGFYADLLHLKPETKYEVEVNLPELEPGRFQGLFFDNVKAEWVEVVR